jgi:hypothetical protein
MVTVFADSGEVICAMLSLDGACCPAWMWPYRPLLAPDKEARRVRASRTLQGYGGL